jgi:hypothetical protein
MNPRKIIMLFYYSVLIPVFGKESQYLLLENFSDEIESQEELFSDSCTVKFGPTEDLNEGTVVYPIEEFDYKTPFESNK